MSAVKGTTLNILVGKTGAPLYGHDTPGDILSLFNSAVLGQLLKTNSAFELLPSLVAEYSYDYTEKSYRLKLREGLKFHDGRPATALDLEYSLLRGFLSPKQSFYKIYLNNIEGIDDIQPGSKFRSGMVSGLRVVDDKTVLVKLHSPNPSFLHVLTNAYFSLVPHDSMKDDHLTWRGVPIGAGPYKVKKPGFSEGCISLERVEPSEETFAKVNVCSIAKKDMVFDVVTFDAPDVTDQHYDEVLSELPASVGNIFFSNLNELGKLPAFHQALRFGIDRSELVKDQSHLKPVNEMLPKHFWGRDNGKDVFSLDRAREFARQIPTALLSQEWQAPVFSSGFTPSYQTRLSRLESQLLRIGIKIRFIPSLEKFMSQESAKRHPMRITNRVSDYVDPLIMFSSLLGDSPYMYEHPTDTKEFDQLYNRAAKALGTEDREQSIRKLSIYSCERALTIPLYEARNSVFVRRGAVASLGSQPEPLTLFIENFVPPERR